jgi:phage gp36-like protein
VAVPAYCEVEELSRFGIRGEALRSITIDDQQGAIDAVSAEIDGYLAAQFTLPLRSWGFDLRKKCAQMVVCDLLSIRGVNSSRPNDEQLFLDRQAAVKWLSKIAAGDLALQVVDSSGDGTAGHVSGGAQVRSNPNRGYTTDRYSSRLPFTGGRR